MNHTTVNNNKALLVEQAGMPWADQRFRFMQGTVKEKSQALYEYLQENTVLGILCKKRFHNAT